ncbi:MAG: conjugal transfer protein TraX, partial [Lachnospiraceae bacterium]|nr:conjugal transfer protein TraX [Lachnospiraceae bacterium]
VLETGQQNIFFTLGLGFIVLCAIEAVEKQAKRSFWMRRLGIALLSVAGCVLAVLGRVDFAAAGVGCIIAMYLMRERGYLWQAVAGCAVCTVLSLTVSQLWCFLAVAPICFYDGSRGKQNKWLFYIIYPAHLLLLWAVCLRL